MAFFGKKKSAQPAAPKIKEKIIHHFVFLEMPIELVAAAVMPWGEAPWWPTKGCSIKYVRKTPGDLQVGTKFRQKILRLLAPSWDIEVAQFIPERQLQFKFLNGPLKGYEDIKLEWRYNGTRVDYELHYQPRGLLNMIIWPILGQKNYDNSIKVVFAAFKEHIAKIYKEQQEKTF
ncbi:MAG: hypothetical protein A2787_07330 [Omnitrophica WOR_2 bacterium RIFCSPHIGHO2_01_FULL_48_9]|nr:MAG: hypothetical protein A3D10_06365 [Omnitrophica WOR_2 bacterium RIFCSPHIGHO2_02_FULL_48_11]OGX33561.1 MAG: hypothetical protein A2787_07330 [Omnitrophica WOR_2 bacterium RIFCSPHIGHO2_01_FULL_48_9]